jgi:predicted DNA-binding transcriptional regulator AlpA
MSENQPEIYSGNFENALFELIRQAVRTEVQVIVRHNEDRLLTINQVAQRLAVSKDWIYRNGKRLAFTRKLGPKIVRFSEIGLEKWLKDKGRYSKIV